MEFVFVVPRHELFPECYPQGFQPFGRGSLQAEFEQRIVEHGFFVERAHAEHNPALKQVIPYCVVIKDGAVLLLRRTRAGGDARLHDKLSIGVGGHVNPEDASPGAPTPSLARSNPIPGATRRELREELVLPDTYETRGLGVLNDDSNPVGAVHVGYVQVVLVEGDVEIREKDVLQGEFVAPERLSELLSEGADFETWSALLVERLDEIQDYSRAACS